MSAVQQALEQARIDGGGTADDKVRLKAWDRLRAQLGTLDSKTSVLLRFNAIIVAALAYVTLIPGAEPFAGASKTILTLIAWISHVSLVAEVLSCGFAFAVINVERGFGSLDDATLQSMGALVDRRARFYSWAWRFAVAGGTGFALLVAVATFH